MKKSSKKVESKNTDEIATTTVAEGVTQAEGTSMSKPSKKARTAKPLFGFDSAKDPVSVIRAKGIHETLPAYEGQERELFADLEVLKGRMASRKGTRIEIDDANGEDIFMFDEKHRNGRTGKMPNNQSSFKLIASFVELGIDDKQIRRLFDRWKLILEFRKLGYVEPRLSVTFYDVVKPLVDLEAKLNALRYAEEEGLTVAELRKHLKKDAPPKTWHDLFVDEVARATRNFTRIHVLMKESGGTPDISVMDCINHVVGAVNKFIPAAKEVA